MFHAALPQALNHGALGAVIGHELAHALDDHGRRFDRRGHAAEEAWDLDATGAFTDKLTCLKTHYGRHRAAPAADYLGVPLPAQGLDADRTADEAFADVSGLMFAYDAYRAGSAEQASIVPGMSNDQLYFLGYAQAWCTNADSLVAQLMAQLDPHAPGGVRVNAALRQMPDFARAFSCRPGARMRVDRPCAIW
jgi:endothelin-converting enzyme/putative endopeptidase